ncbi:MAG TPA: PAS domain S-box protein [Thermoanaerobaculia bacterium]|nr:PAS domain S-box protein [Thermoanaerobaculia bacterium]
MVKGLTLELDEIYERAPFGVAIFDPVHHTLLGINAFLTKLEAETSFDCDVLGTIISDADSSPGTARKFEGLLSGVPFEFEISTARVKGRELVVAFVRSAESRDERRNGDARARVLFDDAPSAIAIIEPQSLRIIDINRAGAGYFQSSPDEIIRSSLLDHLLPSERELIVMKFDAVSHEEAVTGSALALRKSGSQFTLGYRLSHLMVEDRPMVLLMGRDLKDVQRAEARYQQLFERSAEPIMVVAATSLLLIDCNPAFERLLGRGREYLLSTELDSFIDPADRLDVLELFTTSLNASTEVQLEHEARWLRSDGKRLHVAMRSGVFIVDGEKVLISFLRDTTAQRQAEAHYEQMFIKGNDPLLIVEAGTSTILDANPAFEKMSGFALEELKQIDQLKLTALNEISSERWNGLIDPGSAAGETLMLLTTAAGIEIPISVRSSELETSDGSATMMALHDLTAELRAAELERSLTHVQKIESLGQMASGIAHDFNNTLMAALPWADLMRRKYKDDPTIQKAADQIRTAVHRARDVTRQLLDFSQPRKPQKQEIFLTALLQSQLKLIRPVMPPEIELTSEMNEATPSVHADPAQIGQVLLNLALNARDAMPERGTLSISVHPSSSKEERRWGIEHGRYAVLRVTDTGIGMSDETMQKVFDPFFTTKDIGKGSGLGLSVVHRIVEQNGGLVRISSQPNRGTSFFVLLPVTRSEPETPASGEAPFSFEGLHILIVDDERVVAEGLASLLELEGASVDSLDRGQKAIDLIQNGSRPDLVILDLGMPEMRGEKVHEELKKLLPALPVLISSGYGDEERIAPLMLDERNRFLQKPYDTEELLATIASMLTEVDTSVKGG